MMAFVIAFQAECFLLWLKAISYAVGFVSRKRPFSTEARIGLFVIQSNNSFFDSNFFRRSSPTGRSSRNLTSRIDWICQSKNSVEEFYTCFFNPSHRSSYHKAHTSIPSTTQQYHTIVPTLAWLSLLLLLAASQFGAFLAPLASSVYHKTTAARGIDAILPTMATPAVALAAFG